MQPSVLLTLAIVIICSLTLYGCYVAFDRLQTRAEGTHGRQRWVAIGLAAGVGFIALLTFWCCFAFSAGLFQALGMNGR
jgi:hypothetical protein